MLAYYRVIPRLVHPGIIYPSWSQLGVQPEWHGPNGLPPNTPYRPLPFLLPSVPPSHTPSLPPSLACHSFPIIFPLPPHPPYGVLGLQTEEETGGEILQVDWWLGGLVAWRIGGLGGRNFWKKKEYTCLY